MSNAHEPTRTTALTGAQKRALEAIVRSSIDQGAFCQKHKCFSSAEPGQPIRSVYDVMAEQAIAIMEAVNDV